MNLREKTQLRINALKVNNTNSLIAYITRELAKHMDNLTLANLKSHKGVEFTNVRIHITGEEYVNLIHLMPADGKINMFYAICKELGFDNDTPMFSFDDESFTESWTITDTLYFGRKP